jgi:hypothetical protein
MTKSFEMNGIDWTRNGYFGCPSPPSASKLPADLTADPWLMWIVALDRAKQGDFALMPALLTVFKPIKDVLLAQLASYLLGDAGTSTCFQTLTQELDEPDNLDVILDYCRAIHFRGRLADVPLIVRAYERIVTNEDADIIPIWLSNLLEPEDDVLSDSSEFETIEDYSKAVLNRYEELSNEFGTNQILVFRGEQFGVLRLAKYILRRVREPFFRMELRHRFEAQTGIDCSRFYKRGDIHPLRTAAVIEEFLNSADAGNYEDGVRYFFGHRIPE